MCAIDFCWRAALRRALPARPQERNPSNAPLCPPLCPPPCRPPVRAHPGARRSSPRPGRSIMSAARPPEGAHTAAEGTPERAADNAQEGAVLVTGASRGIGRAVAARLMADGLQVLNYDIVPPVALGARETFVPVDLADERALRAALARPVAERPVTRLVNNAGIVRPATIDAATSADLQAVMAVNVAAAILCVQALLPAMRAARFGRIVNISSRAALGKAERIAYAASKAAVHGYTRALALELAADGITVNAIGPGPIATELFERVNPPGAPATQRILDTIPLRRMGHPDDIAHQVASLLDARAGFTTGQVLYVCGGMTVGLAP